MAEVHQFAYGWINPVLAYILSFLGCLLGLVLTARARETTGLARARWLALAAVAIGGTGIWLMHFMAILGFDVPGSIVRYDVLTTVASLLIAVAIVSGGLFVVGMGRPSVLKVVLGGVFTGTGVAAMHYTGMAALHVGGAVSYDRELVAASLGIAIVSAIVALWFAVVVRGPAATVGAGLIMAIAVCSMHYTGMAAVRVHLNAQAGEVPGVSPFVLLLPISILACIVITALAYSTVGFSVHRENAREEALLEQARDRHHAAAMLPRVGTARHR